MSGYLTGEEAALRVPPYMQGVVLLLRERGHEVTIRRSDRNGSWYYSVDGERERNGLRLCNKFRWEYGL